MLNVPTYSQTDPRWSYKPLGTSGTNMYAAGCFTTAVAVILNNYGHQVDPGQLCDALNAHGGYDPEGLLRWNVIEQLYPDTVFADSFNTVLQPTSGSLVQMDTAIKRIRRAVSIGLPVGVCVWVKGGLSTLKPNHIVVLVDAPENGAWTVHDSDGGHIIQLTEGGKYGTPQEAIYGARILVGSPTSFPDWSTEADREDGQACFKAAQVMRGRNVQTYSKEIVDSLLGK